MGIGLAQAGKKSSDRRGDTRSPTISLEIATGQAAIYTRMQWAKILMDQPPRPGEGILHHAEGVDLMPADIQLSGMEVSLNAMSREKRFYGNIWTH